ncbi:lia operon protein LiaF [Paenibacillus eucommiae]|uniref:Lia operon protein LiaF n=1 Tax=Paenibacillus eucommiae TaxID=1355755 RepID=A0ABS4J2I3_9BACL|nr:lia operon protein LiaF [Paenibacillus eucommiae]
MLNQMGVISMDIGSFFSTYWPVFLIYFGLMGFINQIRYQWGGAAWNLIVCCVGVIFLLKNLELTELSIGEMLRYLGPVALIIFGISMILRPSGRTKRAAKEDWDWEKDTASNNEGGDDWRQQWDTQRQAYKEQREQYRQERKHHKHNQHKHNQHCGTNKVDLSKREPAARDVEEERRELSEEEKAVLKDIHGEFAAEKIKETWGTPNVSKPADSARFANSANEPSANAAPPRSGPRPPYEKKNKYYDDFVSNYHTEGVQHKSSFIGDVHLGKEPWELKPLAISQFIGDTVIDLTRASIPMGETKISVSAFIGDVKIFIPNDMDVEVKVNSSSFIGDMKIMDRRESGMMRHLNMQTSQYDEASRKIVLTTSMFIGDVIVKKIG